MKSGFVITLLLAASTLSSTAQNQTPAPTPAEQAITEARQVVAKNPKQAEAYSTLAMALARRARETSDPAFYTQADEILKKAFDLSPGNFAAEKVRVWLLLGKHEFAAALEAAKGLNKRVPDDVMVYGFLTDANAELGNYDDAETATNWMLKLRPGNIPGLARAAYLRELFGDVEGAIDLMNKAYQSTPVAQSEDRAWILTQQAHLNLMVGKISVAERLLQQALVTFPNYHYALGNLAKVRMQQKRFNEAVDPLRQRYTAAPHAENLYSLAEALKLAGNSDEATNAFAEFEQKSLSETNRADNSNHELIFYYADHSREPGKALEVAQREYARRHDVFTLDCYAWALHVNGRDKEAWKAMETALNVGIRDAKLFQHAGEIAAAAGDRASAEKYLRESIALNTLGSDEAVATLARLSQSSMEKVAQ